MKKLFLVSKANVVLSVFLLAAISLSIIYIVRAATPNPGHPSTEVDFSVVTKTGAATLTASEAVVLADATSAAFTLTLPSVASSPYTIFFIKKIDAALANPVTIQGTGGQTIDGLTSIRLDKRGEAVMLESDGSNWRVLGRNQYSFLNYRTKGSTLNQWYTSPNTGTALTTGAPSVNNLRAIPFVVEKLTTIDQMAINVTTLLTGNARIGIYKDNGNMYPGALVVEATVTTQINTGTAGVKVATDGLPVTLEPGLYWLVHVAGTGAATIRSFAVASMIPLLGRSSALGTPASLGWTVAFTYAALPATYPGSGTLITAVPIPAIFVRTSQ